jgi:hypothetical protein
VLLYGQGCAPRPRIANCRLPPVAVEGSGLEATQLASPLMRQHNGDAGANVREGLTRGAGARFGRDRTFTALSTP